MSSASDAGEKEHEPSQKRLDDARSKGEVPRSTDLNTAAGYAALWLLGVTSGAGIMLQAGAGLLPFLDHPDALAADFLHSAAPAGAALARVGGAVLPFFLCTMALVLVSLIAQRAFVVAPGKLRPRLSRVSPLASARNKFGRAGLFEFAKSATKLMIYASVLTLFLASQMPRMIAVLGRDAGTAVSEMLALLVQFLGIVLIIATAIGIADFMWQHAEHRRRNRMSRQELMDEMKNAEGDPHMKNKRRQRGYDIATNRMLADIPQASVVIVNPTHFAVALKWRPSDRHAPICVAKGVDDVAARIRERAMTAGVPIHSDPPTARALHASVEIGAEIRTEHYRAVAAAIRFAEKMRQRARERGLG